MLLPPIPGAQVVRFDEFAANALAQALDEVAERLHRTRRLHDETMSSARVDWKGTTARWVAPEADRLDHALARQEARCRRAADQARRSVDAASALQARYNDEQRQREAQAAAAAQAAAPAPTGATP